MKLCKDCKHVKLPHSLANFAYGHIVAFPMCAHPTATLDPVYGYAIEKCEVARMGPNCGPDAKLFEQREPEPTPPLESINQNPMFAGDMAALLGSAGDHRRSWWKRIFGA